MKSVARTTMLTLTCCLISASGCVQLYEPLATVDTVDLERYKGVWYEIQRYPNSFETGCEGVTAEYGIREDGRVSVLNTCREPQNTEVSRTISGVARGVDDSNAKLKVSFFWPFEGDYWILMLDDDYQYAVVGEPARRFLWILSRTPTLNEETLHMIHESLPDLGYDPERLETVPQF